MQTDNMKPNIAQLMNSINHFDSLLTNNSWINNAKVEDIKTVFKLGAFIENFTKHLSSQNALEEFLNITKTQNHSISKCSDYQKACDYVLKAFFRSENILEATLDIVIRIYTTMFAKNRLQVVLNDLIIHSNQLECLAQYINILPPEKIREYEYCLHLRNWRHLKEVQNSALENEIKVRLTYNIDDNLNNFLGILSLKNISEADRIVQMSILEIIIEKMLDRSILSSSFWYALLQKSNLDVFCNVCDNFKDFRNSVLNFIIYLGSMMENDSGNWRSDPNISLCAKITYFDLLIIIKKVTDIDHFFVFNKLDEAKNDTGSEIWDQIKNEIRAMSNH